VDRRRDVPSHIARRETQLRQLDDRRRVNAKARSTYMGHANIAITLNFYAT
jgi:hypothetical protein